jgi:hypothetical protein
MIKELRKLNKVNHAKANYVRVLQNRGAIKKYESEKGYAAYDTDELKEYYSKIKLGRPLKK